MRERQKTRTAKLARQISPKVERLFPGLDATINNPVVSKAMKESFDKINSGNNSLMGLPKSMRKICETVDQNFTAIRSSLPVLEMLYAKDPRFTNVKNIIEELYEEWKDETEC